MSFIHRKNKLTKKSTHLKEGMVVIVSDKDNIGDKISRRDWDIGTLVWLHKETAHVLLTSDKLIWTGDSYKVSPHEESTTQEEESSEDDV